MTQADFPLAPQPLQKGERLDGDLVLTQFLDYVSRLDLELYPAQEEAILEITQENNVIVNTPTGSGKSLIALAACYLALSFGERAFYTAPIKALVSEKFLSLCKTFGPVNVGMMTGDATVNHDAPIICCTAEILSNLALREGSAADVRWVVMDEFHYYSDRQRGVAWQIPLLTLPQARFLLMSATLGDTKLFEAGLSKLTGAETRLVQSDERPVPLDYSYAETPLHETIVDLLAAGKAPVYVVHFSQRAASEQAQRLTSLDFLSKAEKLNIKEELKRVRFDSPFGKELARFLPHGIGVHHAGMLPKYRLLVERLAQGGLLKVICGTDTLGVGVNIPLRTVLFTQLCKFDGDKVKLLKVRDFHQIAGRAGRRGYDTQGSVVVQAPEHVIENLSAKRKAAGDPKKLKKLRAKKAPEHGFVPWDEQTLLQLKTASPEPLVSRFSVSASMVLNLLCRPDGNGCKALKGLIKDSHESTRNKWKAGRSAMAVFRALVEANIIELHPRGARLSSELQDDFSLNQALSLYAVQVIESLDQEDRSYALIVLSVIESTLENPGAILKRQVDTLKTRKMLEMKHAGMEYDERMTELEKVSYPKPEKEFLWATFDEFAKAHPWILGSSIAPKSIARDMYELGLGFNAYVKEYGLQRAEGVVLRYLSETYRVLLHTVPERCKTEEVEDLIQWLGGEIQSADASLILEWQRMQDPDSLIQNQAEEQLEDETDITRDLRAFVVMVRNEVWRVVQALAQRDYSRLAQSLAEVAPSQWGSEELEQALAPFYDEYEALLTDPRARSPRYLEIDQGQDTWRLRQMLVDPQEDLGWALNLEVDLENSRKLGKPAVVLLEVLSG